jgi:hypothetical protein
VIERNDSNADGSTTISDAGSDRQEKNAEAEVHASVVGHEVPSPPQLCLVREAVRLAAIRPGHGGPFEQRDEQAHRNRHKRESGGAGEDRGPPYDAVNVAIELETDQHQRRGAEHRGNANDLLRELDERLRRRAGMRLAVAR